MESLEFFSDLILPVALWPWGSTQPLTEMSTRNTVAGKLFLFLFLYMFRSCLTIIMVRCYRVSNTTMCAFVQGVIVYTHILHNPNMPHDIWIVGNMCINNYSFPLQAWTGPWGFQEVEAPEFLDNRHMKVVRLSALSTGRLYPPGRIPGTHFC
jgi:hypothetical protein